MIMLRCKHKYKYNYTGWRESPSVSCPARVDGAASQRLWEVARDRRVRAIWHQTGWSFWLSWLSWSSPFWSLFWFSYLPLYFCSIHHIEPLQGLVECEYQFRNDRWNCTDNRDTARIQTTLERGICVCGDVFMYIKIWFILVLRYMHWSSNIIMLSSDLNLSGRSIDVGKTFVWILGTIRPPPIKPLRACASETLSWTKAHTLPCTLVKVIKTRTTEQFCL